MSQPWEIYDALLDGLPGDVVVRAAGQGPRWSRVLNSAGGVGAAWTMDVRSRPALAEGPLEDRPLRDVAALVKSWNLAEASIGQAAINSWYSREETAAANGFEPTGSRSSVTSPSPRPPWRPPRSTSASSATFSPVTGRTVPASTSCPSATSSSSPRRASSTRPRPGSSSSPDTRTPSSLVLRRRSTPCSSTRASTPSPVSSRRAPCPNRLPWPS